MSDERHTNERESGFPGTPATGSLALLGNTQIHKYETIQIHKYINTKLSMADEGEVE